MRPPLASLRSRVFIATAAVAALPVAAALVFVTGELTRQAEAELTRGTVEAARIVRQSHNARLELAAERAALVADLPKLKAAVAEADAGTVEPVARDYRERVHSDAFVVADRQGRTLVALGVRKATWMGVEVSPFLVDSGRLLETVGAPILMGTEAPEVLGYLALGFGLDDDFVSRLRALTGSEVAVARDGTVYASTLPRRFDQSLLAVHSDSRPVRLSLAGGDYVALRVPLAAQERAPFALVLRSRAEALRPLRTLRQALALAALGVVAVGILLSWAVARTVTRPLAALTDAMKEIAATGDLARRIPPAQPWDDEDAKLLAGTFGALTASIARFQRQTAVRDRLSALGRLSTVIAHEVRNPLMIIKGSLRTLKRDGVSAEESREALADVDKQVARLNRTVADVLDFARPPRLEPAPVELAGLVEEAARSALEGAEGIGARFVLSPRAGSIVTDGERLRAVLVNLVENARHGVAARRAAAGTTVVPDEIEIGTDRTEAGRLRLWVEDRGVGIAEADLPHVFEPYFTTKRTGTGLGLAIARKVVEALEGTIRVESREAHGTRVEIELPPTLGAGATEAR